MSYSLKTLWHDRQRFLAGILAVAFSALLIALQMGLLWGLFSITSIPVDRSRADLWITGPNVDSVDLGRAIPEKYINRVARQPEVAETEVYLQGFAYWRKPKGGSELCIVIGSKLDDSAIGPVTQLHERGDLRDKLSEPGAVVVDRTELKRLGFESEQEAKGAYAEIIGHRVRIVDVVDGLKSLAGPYIFCSTTTARPLLRMQPDQTTYVLAKCKPGADPKAVRDRLREEYGASSGPVDMSVFTSKEFSLNSRLHWILKTQAGLALGFAALLGLLVGAVVTSQTLYSATLASLREYAVLRALGIPRWRMAMTVLTQSFWVGVAGLALAIPTFYLLARLITYKVHIPVYQEGILIAGTVAVTMSMALLSGLAALRSLRLIEPVTLLR